MYTRPQISTSEETIDLSKDLEGLMLDTLRPCDTIHVRTWNSNYEVFLLEPRTGRALVKGGTFFTEPTEATVSGSVFGGSMLKLGWLCEGIQMEIIANGQRIVTTPVQDLRVEQI